MNNDEPIQIGELIRLDSPINPVEGAAQGGAEFLGCRNEDCANDCIGDCGDCGAER